MKKLNDESLKLLRESLPGGAVKKIRARLDNKLSVSHIQQILRGLGHRDDVIYAALAIAKEEKDEKDSMEQEILKLASEQ